MFVGHYGPSFLAKWLAPSIPLWILFLAAQLLDVFWAFFIRRQRTARWPPPH